MSSAMHASIFKRIAMKKFGLLNLICNCCVVVIVKLIFLLDTQCQEQLVVEASPTVSSA